MRRMNNAMLSLCLLITLSARAQESIVGRYVGNGRACYGKLALTKKTVTWSTPFSKCKQTPYTVLNEEKGQLAIRLHSPGPACRYRVVALLHHAGEPEEFGWEVLAYPDERGYRADKATAFSSNPPDMLSCYLIRESER